MNLPEFGRRVNRGGAALVLAGTLALCAACGGGGGTGSTASPEAGATPAVSGEVQVTGEVATTTETPAAAATPERRGPQARSVGQVRDPFINPTVGGATVTPAGGATAGAKTPAGGATAAAGATAGPGPAGKAADVPMPKPDIRVTGIVRSGGGFRAILTGPENSYIVASGEKLGAYTVSSISATSVTMTFGKHKFTLPLEQETFGTGEARPGAKAGPSNATKGAPAPPPAPGAPPPPGR